MNVEQIYSLVNSITSELLGKEDLLQEDLSNVIDVGTELFDNVGIDNYVKTLVNKVGKTIFVNRAYSGNIPSVLMDSWEFGSVLEKIQADIPQATENESWDLVDGETYNQDIFYKPSVSAKFFNKKVTFEVPMSFTELQVKESFTSANQLNGFLSMLYNAVENAMTIKIDSLIMRTINNMIAETVYHDIPLSAGETYANKTGIKAVNLLKQYNDLNGTNLTPDKALSDEGFIKYATYTINLYADRLTKISSLFNVGGKERFTPKDKLNIVMLSDFKASANVYLQANTFNKELVELPKADTIPYWQGSGKNYSLEDISSINVKLTKDGNKNRIVNISGILAVMFDREALGVTNLDRRVTTNYNAKAEFFNNYYKFDAGYFNDLNENFVVFFMGYVPENVPENGNENGNENGS